MDGTRLQIRNLDYLVTEEHIERLFSVFGDVSKIRVNRDRGTGYVEMTSATEARRVMDRLDGSVLWGRAMKIDALENTVRHRLMMLLGRFV